jgi:hypothetical protein
MRPDEGADMTEEAAWRELSDRLAALALKLKFHVEQAKDGPDEDGRPKDATVPDAVRNLRGAVDDAFAAAGNAVHDDAVRADVREVGRLFTDAFAMTLARAGKDVRELFEPKV